MVCQGGEQENSLHFVADLNSGAGLNLLVKTTFIRVLPLEMKEGEPKLSLPLNWWNF